jgi:hypothetical protein
MQKEVKNPTLIDENNRKYLIAKAGQKYHIFPGVFTSKQNVHKMYRLRTKLVFWLLSLTFTALDKHTSLLLNL